ncbi:MAG: peptide-methionine (S)-S-oxide reductase [Gemmatimonadota bacterium]
MSGYAGGHVEDPSYEEVTSGRTGHRAAVMIRSGTSSIAGAAAGTLVSRSSGGPEAKASHFVDVEAGVTRVEASSVNGLRAITVEVDLLNHKPMTRGARSPSPGRSSPYVAPIRRCGGGSRLETRRTHR